MSYPYNHWPVIHLRSQATPGMARCGRRPVATQLTNEWGEFSCGACLLPYLAGPLDPRWTD